MKLDGITVVENKKLGMRASNETDKNLRGDSIESNYISFVYIKDCEIYEENGIKYYNAKNAPSIPIVHGGTYYGYGKWKIRKSQLGVWIYNKDLKELHHEYAQCTVYYAYKGKVYTGSIRRILNKKMLSIIEREKEELNVNLHN